MFFKPIRQNRYGLEQIGRIKEAHRAPSMVERATPCLITKLYDQEYIDREGLTEEEEERLSELNFVLAAEVELATGRKEILPFLHSDEDVYSKIGNSVLLESLMPGQRKARIKHRTTDIESGRIELVSIVDSDAPKKGNQSEITFVADIISVLL